MNLRKFSMIAAMGGSVLFASCGDEARSVTVAGLSSLPAATGPVTGSSLIAKAILGQQQIRGAAATTGVLLSAAPTTTFTSRGMCEVSGIVVQAIGGISSPDQIKCYLGSFVDAGLDGFATMKTDNTFNYMAVTTPAMGEEGSQSLAVKFRISNANFTEFEMFTCMGGVQQEYLYQNISTGAITAVSAHTSGDDVYKTRASVAGTLSATGEWVGTKTITVDDYSSYANGSDTYVSGRNLIVGQEQSALTVTAWEAGDWGASAGSRSMYAKTQLIGASVATDSAATMAIGDGAVFYSGTYGGQAFGPLTAQAWNGDTKADVASSAIDATMYAAVTSDKVPTIGTKAGQLTAASINATTESWDCTTFDTASGVTAFTPVDMTAASTAVTAAVTAMAACEGKGVGRGYVDCWSIEDAE